MEVVKYLSWASSPNVYAYKYPNPNISTWSQLVVHESQEAVLFKDGQAIGPFGPGRHVLSTENYPVLTKLLKLVHGGQSPFTADVWFVHKAANLDVKWGTAAPVQLEDPKFHIMLPVTAFGQFGIRVEDSLKFLIKLVGTMPAFTQLTLSNYFRGVVVMRAKDTISHYLLEKGVSIIQIGAHLVEIGQILEDSLGQVFAEYGLKLVNFALMSVSADNKDPAVARIRRAMAERAEMEILGDRYQMKRSFDTMQTAASNAGGGMAGAGMGFGMGMGMGGAMAGMAQQMGANFAFQPVAAPMAAQPDRSAPVPPMGAGANQAPHPASAAQPRFCPNCGAAITPGSKFCSGCGTHLN